MIKSFSKDLGINLICLARRLCLAIELFQLPKCCFLNLAYSNFNIDLVPSLKVLLHIGTIIKTIEWVLCTIVAIFKCWLLTITCHTTVKLYFRWGRIFSLWCLLRWSLRSRRSKSRCQNPFLLLYKRKNVEENCSVGVSYR